MVDKNELLGRAQSFDDGVKCGRKEFAKELKKWIEGESRNAEQIEKSHKDNLTKMGWKVGKRVTHYLTDVQLIERGRILERVDYLVRLKQKLSQFGSSGKGK